MPPERRDTNGSPIAQSHPRDQQGGQQTVGSRRRRTGADLRWPPAPVPAAERPCQARPRRRGDLELADNAPPGGLDQPWHRLEDLRRRRYRIRRHARRLRREPGRTCPSGDRRSGVPPGRPGHPLCPADRGRHRRGRGSGQSLRPALVALHQLGHGVDHGRRPSHAGDHRSGPDHQGRRLLPRPPRLGASVGHARGRRDWPSGPACRGTRQHGHPGGRPFAHEDRVVQ